MAALGIMGEIQNFIFTKNTTSTVKIQNKETKCALGVKKCCRIIMIIIIIKKTNHQEPLVTRNLVAVT